LTDEDIFESGFEEYRNQWIETTINDFIEQVKDEETRKAITNRMKKDIWKDLEQEWKTHQRIDWFYKSVKKSVDIQQLIGIAVELIREWEKEKKEWTEIVDKKAEQIFKELIELKPCNCRCHCRCPCHQQQESSPVAQFLPSVSTPPIPSLPSLSPSLPPSPKELEFLPLRHKETSNEYRSQHVCSTEFGIERIIMENVYPCQESFGIERIIMEKVARCEDDYRRQRFRELPSTHPPPEACM